MFKQVLLFLFVAILGFSTVTPEAHATDMTAALARMDAIISEMQALRAEFASLATATGVGAPTPAVQGSVSGGVLGDDLRFGSTNADIKRVQALLATDPTIYPYGVASGYFGSKTQEAVRLFQSRFGLDTVGVIGPSTKALLEVFFAAYPNGNYPADVLQKATPTAKPVVSAQATTPVASVSIAPKVLKSLSISEDDDEYIVRSYKADGTRNKDLVLYPEDGDELVEMTARKLGASESEVRSLIGDDDLDFGSSRSSSSGTGENDAQDALDDADEAIDETRDAIREAEDDGDNIDDAGELYDEARDLYKEAKNALEDEDYEETVDLAEEAQNLAEAAMYELDGESSGSGDVDSIDVVVSDGEAEVTVEYDSGDEEDFTVDDDDVDDIIEEIADELGVSVRDVEDVIEFDYGDIDKIRTSVSALSGDILVRVYFESGADSKFVFDEGIDDDEIVEEIAESHDLRKSDVEDAL